MVVGTDMSIEARILPSYGYQNVKGAHLWKGFGLCTQKPSIDPTVFGKDKEKHT